MTKPNDQNGSGAPEAGEGNLAATSELEEALREATEAVEARHASREDEAQNDDSPEIEIDLEEGPESVQTGKDSVLSAELEETKQKYVRLAADFDNFRKRTLKEREEAHKYGHQNLVKDLLVSVDNLERAIAHAQKGEEGGVEGLLAGVELVSRELAATLEKHGVTPIDAAGDPFDPALHEAMAQVPDASVAPNTVVEVFQRGYQLRARLLRPARVVVSKTPDEAAEAEAGSDEVASDEAGSEE